MRRFHRISFWTYSTTALLRCSEITVGWMHFITSWVACSARRQLSALISDGSGFDCCAEGGWGLPSPASPIDCGIQACRSSILKNRTPQRKLDKFLKNPKSKTAKEPSGDRRICSSRTKAHRRRLEPWRRQPEGDRFPPKAGPTEKHESAREDGKGGIFLGGNGGLDFRGGRIWIGERFKVLWEWASRSRRKPLEIKKKKRKNPKRSPFFFYSCRGKKPKAPSSFFIFFSENLGEKWGRFGLVLVFGSLSTLVTSSVPIPGAPGRNPQAGKPRLNPWWDPHSFDKVFRCQFPRLEELASLIEKIKK